MANPEPDQIPKLPAALQATLAEHAVRPVNVPRNRDDAVLSEAKRQLRRQIGSRRWRTGMIWAAAAIAVIAMVVWSSVHPGSTQPQFNGNTASAGRNPADLDGDGRVDIFDAFMLARALRDGRAVAAWDVNRDGSVDARDVALVAQRAVQLDRKRRP
jgi:hypothetical protein